jgi:hypothetical protein
MKVLADDHNGSFDSIQATKATTVGCILYSNAGFYVLSGSSQPLIVALLKQAGIADPSCQLYMLFYYLFPSVFVLPLFFNNNWPGRATILKTCVIAVWDILSQTLNYTGASLAGRKSSIWSSWQASERERQSSCTGRYWHHVASILVGCTLVA